MSDLFSKISKGSILLWNVKDESSLPKRKEMIRLLGAEEFIYYKSHGHHKEYIRSLARLIHCLNPDPTQERRSYWPRTEISHFLFAEQEIQLNSLFALKYSNQCLGSYFVSKQDLRDLDELLRAHDQVSRFIDEINDWPSRIENHKEEIRDHGIHDKVIENFNISRLTDVTRDYGKQAIDHAVSKLSDWRAEHFWKI